MLRHNQTLTHLDLSNHNQKVDVKGAQAIAQALRINQTLTHLDLCRNQIGAKGARAIAQALEYNQSLITLDLASNPIGDTSGARRVCYYQERSCKIQTESFNPT